MEKIVIVRSAKTGKVVFASEVLDEESASALAYLMQIDKPEIVDAEEGRRLKARMAA
jgi:hypothetical protein